MLYEEQKKLNQIQAEIKAKMAKYEDDLARKRMVVCNIITVLSHKCEWMRYKFTLFGRQSMNIKEREIRSL